jgi:hypothetical protein
VLLGCGAGVASSDPLVEVTKKHIQLSFLDGPRPMRWDPGFSLKHNFLFFGFAPEAKTDAPVLASGAKPKKGKNAFQEKPGSHPKDPGPSKNES